ncbi:MAG: MBL fold metallo-hydrolase [Proteobacteria bacterium]|nr:MBL fold metallo-hydrolase [Pseudomonadota bacterium]
MERWQYTRGLHEIGDGLFAWLQPDGAWGWSNAGLVASGGQSLLVDTLFDLSLTRDMLDAMRAVEPTAANLDTVVNTHGNGDHWYGNALVADAEIIATTKALAEMRELPPSKLALLMRVAGLMSAIGPVGRGLGALGGAVGLRKLRDLADAAPFVSEIFSPFQFAGIEAVFPNRTFDGRLELQVGHKRVEVLEVGPAHTAGDAIVWLPDDKVVFAGDVLFSGGHPVIWEGPAAGWIAACDRILALKPEIVVPGHGPIGGVEPVKRLRNYLVELEKGVLSRFEAGLSAADIVTDLRMEGFEQWSEAERLHVNVETLVRHLDSGALPPVDAFAQFAGMAKLACRDEWGDISDAPAC